MSNTSSFHLGWHFLENETKTLKNNKNNDGRTLKKSSEDIWTEIWILTTMLS